MIFDAPPGVIANPHAVPRCSQVDLAENRCPVDSQIGTAIAVIGPGNPTFPIPIYNLVPHPGQAGLVGFRAPYLNAPVFTVGSARTEGDYGLNLSITSIYRLLGMKRVEQRLWGVPADSVHDALRFRPPGCDSQGTGGPPPCEGDTPSNAPAEPYLSNPTTCGKELFSSVAVTAFDGETTHATAPYPATTGCDQLTFNPSLCAQPTTRAADSASGFDFNLTVPQTVSPLPSPSAIRGVEATLPVGFSINSNAADGKLSCSDEEAHFDRRDLGAQCHEFAKVGTLVVNSTALPGPFHGYIYLGEPKPGDRYRVLLVVDGFGLHVKLPGRVIADPSTGQLTLSFEDLPQFPFSEFNLHVFGAERGVFATPTRCGTYSVDTTFTPGTTHFPADLEAVLHDRQRPRRVSLPRWGAPLQSRFRGRRGRQDRRDPRALLARE